MTSNNNNNEKYKTIPIPHRIWNEDFRNNIHLYFSRRLAIPKHERQHTIIP
jgi:hypothetical protein